MANVSEKPPPPADHAVSAPMTPFVSKSVPPTAVMYGLAAGKSGWNLCLRKPQPSRPQTPWSPDAKRIESPIDPAFMNAVLQLSMYAVPEEDGRAQNNCAELRQNCARGAPVCCASSLPYETEWMSGDDAFEVISFAQSSSEYWFE